jgi:hypothetical protein
MHPGSFSSIVETYDDTLREGRISMNYLVFLDALAGKLEKILRGIKNMVLKVMQPRLQLTEDQHNDWFLKGTQGGVLKAA